MPQKINPPIHTQAQSLPFEDLAWENFERLCLRLALNRGHVESSSDHAAGDVVTGRMSTRDVRAQGRLYGKRGQKQQGIDLYVHLSELAAGGGEGKQRPYLSLQSRRIAALNANALKKAVTDFLGGSWASVSCVFVYATSVSAVRTDLADEIRTQTARLADNGIGFEVWDADQLSILLKPQATLVHDFFGRAWVAEFCEPGTANSIGGRLDAVQVAEFREQLGRFYASFFDITDSGAVALQQADVPRMAFRDRFVLPDVIPVRLQVGWTTTRGDHAVVASSTVVQDRPPLTALLQQAQAAKYGRTATELWIGPAAPPMQRSPLDEGQSAAQAGLQPSIGAGAVRTSADAWLASAERHVLVGDPGVGKSTFLRYMLLDLLSDAPAMPRWAERFGDRLPIWLPFHFFTQQRARHDGIAASLAATLHAWLDQNDAGHLWSLVQDALNDGRLLLIVDGLDEWVNEKAARSALAAIETFLDQRRLPALVSTRPYGMTRLTLAGVWQYASLASLSLDQQLRLAGLWFRAAHQDHQPKTGSGSDDQSPTAGHHLSREKQTERFTRTFMKEIGSAGELSRLAGIPLFLLLLVGLRLSGIRLPTRRFEVYERAVDRLLKDHPAARSTAAAVTADSNVLHEDDVRQVLAHVAFLHQRRGDFGPVSEGAVRRDVMEALQDPGHLAMDAQTAAAAARPLVEIAEGQLGVLVRQGPRELGFLHRVLLEQLAAEHAADRLRFDDLVDLFSEYATDARWEEVLLAVMWRVKRPHEIRELVEALAAQTAGDQPAALAVREVLAEVVFGGYGLPAADSRRQAEFILGVIDSHPYLPHRQRLLSACISGLSDPTVGRLVVEHLTRWTLASQPLPANLFRHLGRVVNDQYLDEPVWPLLIAALTNEDLLTAQTAAYAIADRYAGSDHGETVRKALMAGLRRAPTADHAAVILLSLLLGWPAESQVMQLAAVARQQQVLPLRLVAVAASLGVLRGIASVGAGPINPPGAMPAVTDDERGWLITRLGVEERADNAWRTFTLDALLAATQNHSHGSAQVRDSCLDVLRKDLPIHGDRDLAWSAMLLGHAQDPAVFAFVQELFATDGDYIRFLGTDLLQRAYPSDPTIAQAVEDALRANPRRHMDTELHALSAIDQGPIMRANLLHDLATSGTPHWAADALAERWSSDDDVQQTLRAVLEGEAGEASAVANAAVRVLGAAAAIERLLAILESPQVGRVRHRRDITVYALLEACEARGTTAGPEAERVAAACLEALVCPADEHETNAEAAVLAVLPATEAARARTQAALSGPQPPLARLIAGYGQDSVALKPLLKRLRSAHPPLPTSVRLHLCTLLQDHPTDGALIRQLTSRWPDEPDDGVRSAASAAFHKHLLRERDAGVLPEAEWNEALTVLRREAVARGYFNWPRRRAAWLGALLIDEVGILDDLHEPWDTQLHLGELARDTDLLLLGELADRWPTLREHFGARLMNLLTGDVSSTDTATTWDYLALVADRQVLLAGELADAVAAEPNLLRRDGVLAWYANAHRGEEDLLNVLISRVGGDGTNGRSLASMLLAEPQTVGLDPEVVRARLHDRLSNQRGSYMPYDGSGAFEALADGFPDDEIVRRCWASLAESKARGEPTYLHTRTYFPLVYAAVPADAILIQVASDIERMATRERAFDEPDFLRAVVRRLGRDTNARIQFETAILDPQSPDTWATQLASFLAVANPLSQEIVDGLSERLHRQQIRPLPDVFHDYVSAQDRAISSGECITRSYQE